MVRQRVARRGEAWRGRLGTDWFGVATLGEARQARPVGAWHGTAGQGDAGKDTHGVAG